MIVNDAASILPFDTAPRSNQIDSVQQAEDSFLTLMLTQLQNQDPIEPMDNGEFLSQLASFETASGIDELNTSFSELADTLFASQSLQSASLVDKDVIAQTNTAVLERGGSVEGRVALEGFAEDLIVEVANSSGAVIRRMSLGPQSGTTSFTWDGRDEDGRRADGGNYTITALSASEDAVAVAPVELATRVESVLLGGSEVQLSLANGTTVPLTNVREIS